MAKTSSKQKMTSARSHVFDRKDKRMLTFGSIYEQSCISKSRPHVLLHQYTQAMITVLLFTDPKKVTMLGLGGGALAHCLLHSIPDIELKAVELRPAVIKVATDYFFYRKINVLR